MKSKEQIAQEKEKLEREVNRMIRAYDEYKQLRPVFMFRKVSTKYLFPIRRIELRLGTFYAVVLHTGKEHSVEISYEKTKEIFKRMHYEITLIHKAIAISKGEEK